MTPSAAPGDHAQPTWTAAASMVGSYDFHTATLLGDGRVLVVGGSANPDAQTAAELFDPGTERWIATGSLATAGESHTATLLVDGRVLVAGGYKGDWLASAALYDPGSGSWTATGSMATARGGHRAALLPDGRVLVIGGNNGADGFYATLASAEMYDPGSGRWTTSGSMATSRGGHSATLLPDGNVLVAGGTSNGMSLDAPMLASAELYDPSSGQWTATGSIAEARATHTATLLPDGRLLVAGGRYAAVASDGLASAELYDPDSGKWTATGGMGEARQNGHTATLLADGSVLVVGDDHTRSAELYDPRSGHWTVTASTLMAPDGAATLLRDGTVLVVSGNFAQLYDPRGRISGDEPDPVSAALPVRGSARAIGLGIHMAPGADGSLFVSIPLSGGSVLLALLASSGRPQPGWPVILDRATSCGQLLPVQDGSIRVLCRPDELNQELNNGLRAFAFDSKGSLLAGWPVDLWGTSNTGRVVGEDLTFIVSQSLSDVIEEGKPSHVDGFVTLGADGSIRRGAQVPMFEGCCQWAVGPDGVAYRVALVSGLDAGSAEVSRITALDVSGVRSGWPISFEGIGSGPAIRPDGRIVVTVASSVPRTSRVLAFDPDRAAVAASSAELPMVTGEIVFVDGPYECGLPIPKPPLVAQDGGMFIFSEIDTAVFALDPSLEVMHGWPYRSASPLERPDPQLGQEGINCPSLAIPAVGPDSTLYLPLQARDATVGGSFVAVGPDGRVRPGWPVELKRPGAEFWSVVVGSDGTVYALAIEPEGANASSATILAIAPDGTVLWTTTIIDP